MSEVCDRARKRVFQGSGEVDGDLGKDANDDEVDKDKDQKEGVQLMFWGVWCTLWVLYVALVAPSLFTLSIVLVVYFMFFVMWLLLMFMGFDLPMVFTIGGGFPTIVFVMEQSSTLR